MKTLDKRLLRYACAILFVTLATFAATLIWHVEEIFYAGLIVGILLACALFVDLIRVLRFLSLSKK
ncbi:MAG: hypothetical protein V1928_02085 [Parcubacteria group bacterium]